MLNHNNFLCFFSCLFLGTRSDEQLCPTPPNFPSSIPLTFGSFENWDREIQTGGVYIASPSNAQSILELANWAKDQEGYSLRPSGRRHSWAPITVGEPDAVPGCGKVVVLDMTGLNATEIVRKGAPPGGTNVSIQTGAVWEDVLGFLEKNGLGLFGYPEVGNVTVGGTIAVSAHGTGISLGGLKPGFKDGSVASLVSELDAVVWDAAQGLYVLKTFGASDPDFPVLLVTFGRNLVTRVTITSAPNFNLRCQSLTNVSADAVFGSSSKDPYSLSSLVLSYGRVDAQLYPYTKNTLIKLWSETEGSPGPNSREIFSPYPFTHPTPDSRRFDEFAEMTSLKYPALVPVVQQAKYDRDVHALESTETGDIWGPSKDLLLYYSTYSQKFNSLGYVVLTTKGNIQQVAAALYSAYVRISKALAQNNLLIRGKYPMNYPLQVRVSGLDKGVWGNSLSLIGAVPNHPEYDVAVYFGLHCYPGTRGLNEFMIEWERFIFKTFTIQPSSIGSARVEWAKSYAFTEMGPWTNTEVLKHLSLTFGEQRWNDAVAKLNSYDPNFIFYNDYLAKLLK